MADPIREVAPELIDEARRVRVELEELRPALQVLLDRARNVFSAFELALLGTHETWQEQYDAFDERTGRARLYGLVFDLHESTSDWAMQNDELRSAHELEAWGARIECHGNTEPCSETDACERFR